MLKKDINARLEDWLLSSFKNLNVEAKCWLDISGSDVLRAFLSCSEEGRAARAAAVIELLRRLTDASLKAPNEFDASLDSKHADQIKQGHHYRSARVSGESKGMDTLQIFTTMEKSLMLSIVSSTMGRLTRLARRGLPAVLFLLLASSQANGASFDCKKARTSVEQAVCLDPNLSRQDEVMKDLYVHAMDDAADKVILTQSQRDWIRLVRNRCSDTNCLAIAYSHRIAALSNGYALQPDDSIAGVSASSTQPTVGVQFLPAGANFERYVTWMQNNRVLDSALELVRARAPKASLPVVVGYQCGQDQKAFYLSQKNLVVLCYEFVDQLNTYYVANSRKAGSSAQVEGAKMFMTIQFTVLHEIGHALFHRQKATGSLGAEETEADNFASAILLGSKTTVDEVQTAVWSVWGLTTAIGMKALNDWSDYGDEHALPQQRFATFACLALGRAPSLGPWLAKSSVLTERRVARCPSEWERASTGLWSLLQAAR